MQIRRLKIEDAEEITRIYAAITRKPASADFKRVVEDHARREDGACFVAEMNGQVVGFMISTILTAGFGMPKSAWIATLGVNRITWARASAPAWQRRSSPFIAPMASKTFTPRCAGTRRICCLSSKPSASTAAISSTCARY